MTVVTTGAGIHQVLESRAVTTVYQPLVHLSSRRAVGYEALSRGPAGSPWEQPQRLFAAAREAGVLAELDWLCRASAYAGALRASMPAGMSLFVNVEPDALGSPCPSDLRGVVHRAERSLRVVTEVTERSLTNDPAALLAAAAHARSVGWGVAVDDVGRDPAMLGLMPFVHPDVVRLSADLVRGPADASVAAVAAAAMAQAERTGAVVIAEGVETEADRRRALALGATVGQGWLFGHPHEVRPSPPVRDVVRLLDAPALPREPTPYDIVRSRRAVGTAPKSTLVALSHHLEEVVAPGQSAVVLSTFQSSACFSSLVAGRYARLARTSTMVAALGPSLGPEPVAGVRGAQLAADDPVADDWTVLVVGPHVAAGLVARDLGDSGPDGDRRYSFCLTHDRDLVLDCARSLLLRITPR